MALNDLELSLMAFPQHWDGASGLLSVNLLLLPVGDPTAPLGTGPQFAGTPVHLSANFVAGLASLPSTSTTPTQVTPFFAQPQPVAPTLYSTLYNQLVAQHITVTSAKLTKAQAPPAGARILKQLPASYTQAFPFETPRSATSGWATVTAAPSATRRLRSTTKHSPVRTPASLGARSSPMRCVSRCWRTAMGLIYAVQLNIPASLLASGGFVYFTLDSSVPGNPWVADWLANPDSVKSYAARLPALATSDVRPLLAARLIPVVTTPPSDLTEAQFEAEEYDDGFAQIVHSNQPTTIDAATLDDSQIAPGTDAGIQVGWDDEQVTCGSTARWICCATAWIQRLPRYPRPRSACRVIASTCGRKAQPPGHPSA